MDQRHHPSHPLSLSPAVRPRTRPPLQNRLRSRQRTGRPSGRSAARTLRPPIPTLAPSPQARQTPRTAYRDIARARTRDRHRHQTRPRPVRLLSLSTVVLRQRRHSLRDHPARRRRQPLGTYRPPPRPCRRYDRPPEGERK